MGWHRGFLPYPDLHLVTNAIVDALGELGVNHIEMAASPYWVWRAIRPGYPAARGRS